MQDKPFCRCAWVHPDNPRYIAYHDKEWGVPTRDDRKLYEMLILESFQAGLSWECVLNKREAFIKAFDAFDPNTVAHYGEEKEEALMQDPGIIRNRRKIRAAIRNSRIFQDIQREFGSFYAYLTSFTGEAILIEPYTLRTTSPLSDAISADLKKRGMTFVGSTIVYSYLQAVGILNAHGAECSLCPQKHP